MTTSKDVQTTSTAAARTARKPRRRRNGPVLRRRAPMAVWREALRYAEGDAGRCEVQPDGESVIVWNNANRRRSS